MKISLCLLTRNELKGCQQDVPRIPLEVFDEVFAVDGSSTDGTQEFLTQSGIPVFQQPRKSLNAAYHYAVEKAAHEALVVFFPKGTIAPESLADFRPLLEAGNDLVIASRKIAGAVNEEDSSTFRPRKWCVQSLAILISLLWRKASSPMIWDVLHGVKGFRKDTFQRMNISESGITIDLEMAIRAYKLKLKTNEFPVHETARQYGSSNFKMLPTGKALLRCLYVELTNPPRQNFQSAPDLGDSVTLEERQ